MTARAASGREAIDIEWIEKFPDLRPGVMYFNCDRMCAAITRETCEKNWREARARRSDEDGDRRSACRNCPIGAKLHSEEQIEDEQWLDYRNANECVRCGRSGIRLVVATAECVSCWNRRRECAIGRNARGKKPTTDIQLKPHRVGIESRGKLTYRHFHAWHQAEAISQAIRLIPGVKFHGEQPGQVVWNCRTRVFQYRCYKHHGEFGTLRESVQPDGTVEYICPVCRPSAARVLPDARVVAPTNIQPAEFLTEMLSGYDLTPEWIPTNAVCSKCRHYTLLARRRSGVETRCPFCEAKR